MYTKSRNILYSCILLLVSCNSQTMQQEADVSSYSPSFKYFALYSQTFNESKYIIDFHLYSIPDTLKEFYSMRDSLIRLAVQGDKASLEEVRKRKLDEESVINLDDYFLSREYMFTISESHYIPSIVKIIWFEDSGYVHLPTLNININF